MSINKYEICVKSIINAISQLDKLNIGSYEQRIEVIVTLLEKFNLIQSTEKLESQNKKLIEALMFYANNVASVWDCNGETLLEKCSETARAVLKEVGANP